MLVAYSEKDSFAFEAFNVHFQYQLKFYGSESVQPIFQLLE